MAKARPVVAEDGPYRNTPLVAGVAVLALAVAAMLLFSVESAARLQAAAPPPAATAPEPPPPANSVDAELEGAIAALRVELMENEALLRAAEAGEPTLQTEPLIQLRERLDALRRARAALQPGDITYAMLMRQEEETHAAFLAEQDRAFAMLRAERDIARERIRALEAERGARRVAEHGTLCGWPC